MKKFLSLLTIIFFINVSAQNTYFPTKENWETKSPEFFEYDSKKLNKAIEFVIENQNNGDKDLRVEVLKRWSIEPYHTIKGPTKKRGEANGLIIKDGYIIASWGDTKRVDMTFSVTKSYLSAVAGIAVDKKLIRSEKDYVSNYIWDKTFDGEKNSRISWENLLNQSSDWAGNLFGINDWEDRPDVNKSLDEWRLEPQKEPGTFYKYNDVRVNVLAYSLLQIYRESLPKVLKKTIMDPIGASDSWRWYGYENSWVNIDGLMIQSVSGGGHSGGGIFINSEDHARFGLLYLNKGKWNGKRIISEEWIKKSITPSKTNPEYGYMWWINSELGKDYQTTDWKNVPTNIFYGSGFGGNEVIIIPDENMVIVGRWFGSQTESTFIKMVLDSK
jgi:CubicO group peptidase (beta-lactamase class C family)|tara:strand:+ start:1653 stop:2810 length:1158 start_codon:yes stop_codon:yes gene_type:complete